MEKSETRRREENGKTQSRKYVFPVRSCSVARVVAAWFSCLNGGAIAIGIIDRERSEAKRFKELTFELFMKARFELSASGKITEPV